MGRIEFRTVGETELPPSLRMPIACACFHLYMYTGMMRVETLSEDEATGDMVAMVPGGNLDSCSSYRMLRRLHRVLAKLHGVMLHVKFLPVVFKLGGVGRMGLDDQAGQLTIEDNPDRLKRCAHCTSTCISPRNFAPVAHRSRRAVQHLPWRMGWQVTVRRWH